MRVNRRMDTASDRSNAGDQPLAAGRIPHRWTVPGPGDTRLVLVVGRTPD